MLLKSNRFEPEENSSVSEPEASPPKKNIKKSLSTSSFLKHTVSQANPKLNDDLVDGFKNKLNNYYSYRFGLGSFSAFVYLLFFELSDEETFNSFITPIASSFGLFLSSYRWWLNCRQYILSNNKDLNSFLKVILNGLIIITAALSLTLYGLALFTLNTFYLNSILPIGLLAIYVPKSILKIGQATLWFYRGLIADKNSDRYDECYGRAGKYFWSAVYSIGIVAFTVITTFTDVFSFGSSKIISTFILLGLSALNTYYNDIKDYYREVTRPKKKKHSPNLENEAENNLNIEQNPQLSERAKLLSYLKLKTKLFKNLSPDQIKLLQKHLPFLSTGKKPTSLLSELSPSQKEKFMNKLKNINDSSTWTKKEITYIKDITGEEESLGSLTSEISSFLGNNERHSPHSRITRIKSFFGFEPTFSLANIFSDESREQQQSQFNNHIKLWVAREENYATSTEASIAKKTQEMPDNLRGIEFDSKETLFIQSQISQLSIQNKEEIQKALHHPYHRQQGSLYQHIPEKRFFLELLKWHEPGANNGRFGYTDLKISLESIKTYCEIFPECKFSEKGIDFLVGVIQKKLDDYQNAQFSHYFTKQKTDRKILFLTWLKNWLSSDNKQDYPLKIDDHEPIRIDRFQDIFPLFEQSQNHAFAIDIFSSTIESRGEVESLIKLVLHFFDINAENTLSESNSISTMPLTENYDSQEISRESTSSHTEVLKILMREGEDRNEDTPTTLNDDNFYIQSSPRSTDSPSCSTDSSCCSSPQKELEEEQDSKIVDLEQLLISRTRRIA